MRTIVISDIHGYYRTFLELLSQVAYNSDKDRLFLLGDYVDGGPAALEVVRWVQIMSENPLVRAIGGNHDEMFLHWLDDRDYPLRPYTHSKNGGLQTIQSFCPWYSGGIDDEEARQYIKKQYSGVVDFLRLLPDYLEDEHHIYVHAGIDPEQVEWKQTSHKHFRWIRGRFYENDGKLKVAKKIIFGHEVCARLHRDEHNFTPWFGMQIICIDGGIKFGKRLNALIIDTDGNYHFESIEEVENAGLGDGISR